MSKPTFLLYFLSPYLFWSEWHWYQTHNVLILLIPKKEKKKVILSPSSSRPLLLPFSFLLSQTSKAPKTQEQNPKQKLIESETQTQKSKKYTPTKRTRKQEIPA